MSPATRAFSARTLSSCWFIPTRASSCTQASSLRLHLAAMSTSGPTLYKFAVWAPDATDPEAFSRRMAVRESHLANAKKISASGTLST